MGHNITNIRYVRPPDPPEGRWAIPAPYPTHIECEIDGVSVTCTRLDNAGLPYDIVFVFGQNGEGLPQLNIEHRLPTGSRRFGVYSPILAALLRDAEARVGPAPEIATGPRPKERRD